MPPPLTLITQVQDSPSPGVALHELPPAAHLPMALALVAGFLLWMIGGRLVRPAFCAVGSVIGAFTGFLLLPLLGAQEVLGFPSPYAGLVVGGLSGLVVSIVAFRLAMALLAAGALGLGGLLTGMIVLQMSPGQVAPVETTDDQQVTALAIDQMRGALRDTPMDGAEETIRALGRQSLDSLNEDTRRAMQTAYGKTRAFLDRLAAQARAIWEGTTPRQQVILAGSTLLGACGGLLLGLAAPRRSAAIVSAMTGSAVMLASGTWLVFAFEIPGRGVLHRSPMAWITIWLAVAILGMALQSRSKPQPASAS